MDRRIYSEEMLLSLRRHFERESSKYITYPKFIFLCGRGFGDDEKYSDTNRGIIDNYIKKTCPDAFIVLSEQLWETDFSTNIDLLTFEEFLAEVSDAIILFVESPGTYCELGAFAYADALFSDKLIIVMDEKYRGGKSFLADGPVSKARKDGSNVVYAPLNSGALLSSKELRDVTLELVSRFRSKSAPINKRTLNKDANRIQVNSFIVEILELIRITQPVSVSDLTDLYKKVKGFTNFKFAKRDGNPYHSEIKLSYIFKLLENVNILKNDGINLTLVNHKKTQSIMLKYHGHAELVERNRMLCRKYKWGGKI